MRALFIFLMFLSISNIIIGQKTIIWSIKKPNSDNISYLLGTMHQMGNSFIDGKPFIKEQLIKSDLAIFEAIGSKSEEVLNVLLTRPDDFTYREQLFQEDVEYLEQNTSDWKVPISKIKPGELIGKLQQENILKFCGTVKPNDKFKHMDDYLQELAKNKHVQIYGLESYSEQITAINRPAEEELNWLKVKESVHRYIENAKNADKNRINQICGTIQDYMLQKLEYELSEKCFENDNLLSDRNKKWIPKIINSLEKHNNVFIAVGFFHLVRECGIVAQLRKNGYKVKPIKIN